MQRGRWNHNIHYHRVVLAALPARCRHVLDVGCGDGVLTRKLGRVAQRVTGIDLDDATIGRARDGTAADHVDYVAADFLAHPFPSESFDAVVSIAALHHMDAATALARMAALLRPGGTLAVIGLARSNLPADLPIELAAAVATRLYELRHSYWEDGAPKVWPPPCTYRELRAIAATALPDVRYRRHLLWRYSLVWRKPTGRRVSE